MTDFSFGFTDDSFVLLKGQKHLRSVEEDLISSKQKELKEVIKKGKATDIIKLSSQYFSAVHNFSDFYSLCENKCHVIKTSCVWLHDRM